MFNVKSCIGVTREVYKTDFGKHSPSSLLTVNKNNSTLKINISSESIFSLNTSYILPKLEVTENVSVITQLANNELSSVNL